MKKVVCVKKKICREPTDDYQMFLTLRKTTRSGRIRFEQLVPEEAAKHLLWGDIKFNESLEGVGFGALKYCTTCDGKLLKQEPGTTIQLSMKEEALLKIITKKKHAQKKG